jgi:hypothetical protein
VCSRPGWYGQRTGINCWETADPSVGGRGADMQIGTFNPLAPRDMPTFGNTLSTDKHWDTRVITNREDELSHAHKKKRKRRIAVKL